MVKLEFPDGSVKEFEDGVTGIDVANSISEGLGRSALCVKLNGIIYDLKEPINESSKISIITFRDDIGKSVFWHSSAHVLAIAVKRLYPQAKLAIGPSIDEGFYYDFEVEKPFTPDDLTKIEEEYKKIIKEKLSFEKKFISYEDSKELFKDNVFKREIIEDNKENLSVYYTGDFYDLCKGPHIPNTGKIKAVKLTKVSSAYWRGDSKNTSLQRIYGISFADKKELKKYIELKEEAEKRNHVKIGKQLDLFSMHPEGPGFPFFHHKGMLILNELINFWREKHYERGYLEVKTPIILGRGLWEQSGHWNLYKDNMYTTKIDDRDFAIKPMNCPGGMLIYKERSHSYRELPMRVGELGQVHRHELSGTLNGLLRVRTFTQDDAHIFCSADQLQDEIIDIVKLIKEIYSVLGFEDYKFTLSIRSDKKKDKYLGNDEEWNWAENSILEALKKLDVQPEIMEGEAKFYGPSLDVQIKDSLNREWQCSTIQLDFNLAKRFDITYEGKDGTKETPYILHRVIYGSLERMLGILIEHYAGKFPLWLSPNKVIILPVADRFSDYAKWVSDNLRDAGITCDIDYKMETIPKKVRNAQLQQYNYILVVGEKEIGDETVTVRTRDNVVEGTVKLNEFRDRLVKEINDKS